MPSIHIPEETFEQYVAEYGYQEAKQKVKQATEEWIESDR